MVKAVDNVLKYNINNQREGTQDDAAMLHAHKLEERLLLWLRNVIKLKLPITCHYMRDEVIGGCRKLHNEELHNFYCSPSIIRIIKSRRMRWAGHVARMGAKRKAYTMLMRKPEGKRPLGRLRRRWVDNIKMDLREIGWGGRDWIDLA
jgi:hypothetical protein